MSKQTDDAPFPDRLFRALFDRSPTEAERIRMGRIMNTFGLRDNDAFFAIIMTLELYLRVFRANDTRLKNDVQAIPQAIRTIVREEIARGRLAEPAAGPSVEPTWSSRLFAGPVSPVVIALVPAALVLAGAFLGYHAGAARFDTPDGRAALRLMRTGEVRALATCGKPGWAVADDGKSKWCMAREAPEGVRHGWRIQ